MHLVMQLEVSTKCGKHRENIKKKKKYIYKQFKDASILKSRLLEHGGPLLSILPETLTSG